MRLDTCTSVKTTNILIKDILFHVGLKYTIDVLHKTFFLKYLQIGRPYVNLNDIWGKVNYQNRRSTGNEIQINAIRGLRDTLLFPTGTEIRRRTVLLLVGNKHELIYRQFCVAERLIVKSDRSKQNICKANVFASYERGIQTYGNGDVTRH